MSACRRSCSILRCIRPPPRAGTHQSPKTILSVTRYNNGMTKIAMPTANRVTPTGRQISLCLRVSLFDFHTVNHPPIAKILANKNSWTIVRESKRGWRYTNVAPMIEPDIKKAVVSMTAFFSTIGVNTANRKRHWIRCLFPVPRQSVRSRCSNSHVYTVGI